MCLISYAGSWKVPGSILTLVLHCIGRISDSSQRALACRLCPNIQSGLDFGEFFPLIDTQVKTQCNPLFKDELNLKYCYAPHNVTPIHSLSYENLFCA